MRVVACGWVNIAMMIDPNGKAYEPMVSQSSGNKLLDKAALDEVGNWTFEPASLDGKPIDSAYELKVTFKITDQEKGATPPFATAYRALRKALDAKDKQAADAAMARLKIANLYEDAFYGLAKYGYAKQWAKADPKVLAQFEPAVEQMQKLRTDNRAYSVDGLCMLHSGGGRSGDEVPVDPIERTLCSA